MSPSWFPPGRIEIAGPGDRQTRGQFRKAQAVEDGGHARQQKGESHLRADQLPSLAHPNTVVFL